MSPANATDSGSTAPLVSVVIPAYNAEAFVLDAIRSVQAQGYAPLDIVLVDDGSRDRTVELVRAAAPEVRIVSQPNAGVAAARNTGLREARGDYICFLDADDGWFPGKLAAQVDYLQRHPDTGLVYHHWLVWEADADGRYRLPAMAAPAQPGEIVPALSGWIYTKLLFDCIVHTSTVMIRREIAEAVGFFDTALVAGEDYDYWLRTSRLCRIDKLAATYSYYRAVPGSLTNRPKAVDYEYRVISAAFDRWGATAPDGSSVPAARVQARLAKLAMDFGYGHYHRGSPDVAWRAYLTALRHDPRRWRAMAYLVAARLKAMLPG
ncbi:glycosyltransferase [Thauera sp. CAU 1555]|uniref:Glycosyltransferase n=1 Tax=Thauera sedimentorum TaxID=2767595 RepID=A0ABR9BEB5_9RHOO|nr:glycosyltransferase [Thauera sedimentorum]MBC9073648.1 glycosyltransferase [Thauera sedimentorum]MBD8504567.1 glycosyltransferase [Thauera sedimentorum]